VSRFNALKTGITAKSMVIPGEDAAELESLAAEYHRQFPAVTALERFLVDALVSADWQLRRLRRVEAQLWSNELAEAEGSLGQVFSRGSRAFLLLQRRIDSTERSYYRALNQLQRLHEAALGDPEPLAGEDTPELASFSSPPFEIIASVPPAADLSELRPSAP